ncbi:MAG: hypothetical protein JW967_07335, partial [Dehalococcoidales bacterium]|nr:hypothetical protein [Dehalococcoidales bacterium]
MEILIAQLINGLALGSIYAMLVVAFNLLLLVKGVFHYSLIHITVVTMFVCWLILDLTGSLAWAIPVSIISAIILNILTEPLFRPLVKRKAVIETMCLSMGVAMVFTEIMSHQINNGVPIGFPSGIVGGGGSLQVGLIYFSLANIYTIIACLVAVFIFYYFLFRHKEGRALRAIAQNLSVARILGIS